MYWQKERRPTVRYRQAYYKKSTHPLEADSLAEYYDSMMQDFGNLSSDQQRIADVVN